MPISEEAVRSTRSNTSTAAIRARGEARGRRRGGEKSHGRVQQDEQSGGGRSPSRGAGSAA